MYIKLPNIYPYHPERLRQDHKGTSFPTQFSKELLALYDVYEVLPTNKPEYNTNTQTIDEILPILIDDQWIQQWSIRELTEQELEDRIPKEVTALQGMLAINQSGLVNGFLTWKNSLDPITDFSTISFLEKAQNWKYDDPTLNSALETLNITHLKKDLFTLAASL